MKFPNDADGEVLKLLHQNGVDFSKEHVVDFFISVPNQRAGEYILSQLSKDEFECEIEKPEDTEEWLCICSKNMFLSYEEIIAVQKKLMQLSKNVGGYSDGWATFGD